MQIASKGSRNQMKPWIAAMNENLDEQHLPQQIALACATNPSHIPRVARLLNFADVLVDQVAAGESGIGGWCLLCRRGTLQTKPARRRYRIDYKGNEEIVREGLIISGRIFGFEAKASYCPRCKTLFVHAVALQGPTTPFEIFNRIIETDPN